MAIERVRLMMQYKEHTGRLKKSERKVNVTTMHCKDFEIIEEMYKCNLQILGSKVK